MRSKDRRWLQNIGTDKGMRRWSTEAYEYADGRYLELRTLCFGWRDRGRMWVVHVVDRETGATAQVIGNRQRDATASALRQVSADR
jgi:hypothetical protein